MKVFASAVGQYDNVGDTVLRRGYLTALRAAGPLTVYVGSQTEDHLEALGLNHEDVLVHDSAEWRALLSRMVGRTPFLYGFDTGETVLERRFAARYARLAPLLALNRARGGRAVHVGVGVRDSSGWRRPIQVALRGVDVVSWRDRWSRTTMGVGEVTPDWAFAHPSWNPGERDRPLISFALRAALPHAPRREPDDAWADRARALADAHGLQPMFVAQIGRDGPLAERLAARAGADALVWESGNHSRFEERLRAVYAHSALIVSDRLHGLVIGATEGALPVPLADRASDKTVRTLEAAGISGTAIPASLEDAHGRAAVVLGRRAELIGAVDAARQRLRDLEDRIGALAP